MQTADQQWDHVVERLIKEHRGRLVLVVAFVVALVLGTIGYREYMCCACEGASWGNALYHTAQLFIFHSPHFAREVPWTLEAARWLAPVTAIMGLFGVGSRIFRDEVDHWKLRGLKQHAIVCGLGRKGMELVRHLRAGKQPVAVIEKNPQPDFEAECRALGVPVLAGDATRKETLEQARLDRAVQLFAVCPEDSVNCDIAGQARTARQFVRGRPLACHIHLGDVELREALQQTLPIRPDGEGGGVDFHFFDVMEPEARRLIVEGLPLDHDGVAPDDPRSLHLVIMGFGRMGRTLALRAAQIGCFANGKRLRISVIDREAEARRAALLFRHPQIDRVADLKFHPQEAASPATRQCVEKWCAEADSLTSIAVCFDNDALAVLLGLQLLPILQDSTARLAVRLGAESGLASLLGEARHPSPPPGQVCTFGMES